MKTLQPHGSDTSLSLHQAAQMLATSSLSVRDAEVGLALAIDRGELFVTNAVKHFKHEPRGKRRLHTRPNAGEVELCRWWVVHELKLVRPRLVVALGATALQSLSNYRGTLTNAREQTLKTREGAALRVTVHPSYLLRLPDEEAKAAEFERFVTDLKQAKRLAERMARAA